MLTREVTSTRSTNSQGATAHVLVDIDHLDDTGVPGLARHSLARLLSRDFGDVRRERTVGRPDGHRPGRQRGVLGPGDGATGGRRPTTRWPAAVSPQVEEVGRQCASSRSLRPVLRAFQSDLAKNMAKVLRFDYVDRERPRG